MVGQDVPPDPPGWVGAWPRGRLAGGAALVLVLTEVAMLESESPFQCVSMCAKSEVVEGAAAIALRV